MTWRMASIPADAVTDVWPSVAGLLKPALGVAGGRLRMRDVYQQLKDERLILWTVRDEREAPVAALVTRVAQYPSGKRMLAVDACGGSRMDEWLQTVVDTLMAFASASGLKGLEMFGRPGWQRVLARHGWRTPLVLCEIDVPEKVT